MFKVSVLMITILLGDRASWLVKNTELVLEAGCSFMAVWFHQW